VPSEHRQLPDTGIQCRQFGLELEGATECSEPLGDGGENRERPFATKAESGEAAIRYALAIFSLNFGNAAGADIGDAGSVIFRRPVSGFDLPFQRVESELGGPLHAV
jgi:hypothetical protein